MAITPIIWFVFIQGSILVLASAVFTIVMIHNFMRKRTMGTALLTIVYGMISITYISDTLLNVWGVINPYSIVQDIFIIVDLSAMLLTYFFLYNFASRHILKDNDVTRAISNLLILGITTVIIAIFGYEAIINPTNPIFAEDVILEGSKIPLTLPNMLGGVIMYLGILILVHSRIIYSISVNLIRNKGQEEIRRRGLRLILFAILLLFLTVLLTVGFTFPFGPIITILLYVIRAITLISSIFLSYVGWILPNWYRRRIRRQAWISQQIAVGKEPSGNFISSTNVKQKNIVEITET